MMSALRRYQLVSACRWFFFSNSAGTARAADCDCLKQAAFSLNPCPDLCLSLCVQEQQAIHGTLAAMDQASTKIQREGSTSGRCHGGAVSWSREVKPLLAFGRS